MIKSLLKIFNLLGQNQKKKLIHLQILIILTSVLEVLSLLIVGQFMLLITNTEIIFEKSYFLLLYNFFNFKDSSQFALFFSIFVLFFFILTTCVSIFTIWKLSMYGSKIGSEISIRVYKYFISQDWIFFTKNNSSSLISKIANEAGRINSAIIQPFMHMNARLVLSVFIVISIFLYDFFSSLIGLAVFLFSYLLLYKTVRKKLYNNGVIISKTQDSRLKIMTETFGSIKEILLYGRKNFFEKKYTFETENYAKAYGFTQVLMSMPRYIIELVAICFLSILMTILVFYKNVAFESILPFLTVFGFAVFKLLPSFQQIYSSLSSIKANLSAFKNLENDLEKSLNLKNTKNDENNNVLLIKNKIVLKNISYYYIKNQNILSDINISISKNSLIGFAGPSGCGKSTLADIIMGLIKPVEGNVMLDDKNIIDCRREWQNNIGYVSQSIFLIDASIQDNIIFGVDDEKLDKNKLNRCLEMSNLSDFVKRLPNGVDTLVGEKGIKISGGQKQRIAIARALYHDANFLIFDEATSSLDGISEKKILDSIQNLKGKLTIVLIAHRLATLKYCDLIYFMENGKIIDSGNYEYLINNNSSFIKMSENYNPTLKKIL